MSDFTVCSKKFIFPYYRFTYWCPWERTYSFNLYLFWTWNFHEWTWTSWVIWWPIFLYVSFLRRSVRMWIFYAKVSFTIFFIWSWDWWTWSTQQGVISQVDVKRWTVWVAWISSSCQHMYRHQFRRSFRFFKAPGSDRIYNWWSCFLARSYWGGFLLLNTSGYRSCRYFLIGSVSWFFRLFLLEICLSRLRWGRWLGPPCPH